MDARESGSCIRFCNGQRSGWVDCARARRWGSLLTGEFVGGRVRARWKRRDVRFVSGGRRYSDETRVQENGRRGHGQTCCGFSKETRPTLAILDQQTRTLPCMWRIVLGHLGSDVLAPRSLRRSPWRCFRSPERSLVHTEGMGSFGKPLAVTREQIYPGGGLHLRCPGTASSNRIHPTA
jgi:hypothetical protein